MNDEKQMLVAKINQGTVIDKIPAGKSLQVLRALNIVDDVNDTVAVALRVKSESMGRKDFVKLTNRFLEDFELKKIWIIAPDAVITTIKDFKVAEKFKVSDRETSNIFSGVLKCNNPTCATNFNEPVKGEFLLMQREPMLVRCMYCDRVMVEENIKSQL